MAMACIKGGKECTGCMSCHVSEEIGYCAVCGEPIEYGEDHYDIDGELIHEDCLRDWADKFRK